MRRALLERIGGALTAAQYADAEQLGVLVDKSGEGVLLQIFTAAVATDRPTLFFEVIQRIGCERQVRVNSPASTGSGESSGELVAVRTVQAAGCGGFGKGNVKELYVSMERYVERLGVADAHESQAV